MQIIHLIRVKIILFPQGIVFLWSKAIVGLRDNIMFMSRDLSDFDSYHINLLRRVRNVANNIQLLLLPIVECNQATLTEFVREYWVDAKRGSEINWRQVEDPSKHVFLGLLY